MALAKEHPRLAAVVLRAVADEIEAAAPPSGDEAHLSESPKFILSGFKARK